MNTRRDDANELASAEEAQRTLAQDFLLGRCPYCHGERVLVDPVFHDEVPCICATEDGRTHTGLA